MDNSSTTKKVSFFLFVSVHETLHISDYSDAEKAACWYNSKEQLLTAREIRNTTTMMRISELTTGDTIDSDLICTRGLERFDELAHLISLHAVFDEQDLRWQQGCECKPEELAKIYSAKTEECQLLAILKGHADQLWVAKETAKNPFSKQQLPRSDHRRRTVTDPACLDMKTSVSSAAA